MAPSTKTQAGWTPVRFTKTEPTTLDPSLLERVASGEPGAIETCLDSYGGLVWTLARRFCNTHADAEDAVQEIFADLWTHAGRFNPAIAAEKTFIAMIARRRLIDRRRREGRAPRFSGLESAELAPSEDTSTAPVDIRDEAARIRELMGQLRPEQQKALRLSICDGLTHQDVAEAMNLPLGTVKTHIRRGLIAVRELAARGPGGEEVAS